MPNLPKRQIPLELPPDYFLWKKLGKSRLFVLRGAIKRGLSQLRRGGISGTRLALKVFCWTG